ncbi:MAG TPA: M48 family metalloprotease, partial [Blastocatellia bacterium]
EAEADRLGAQYLWAAGYDPNNFLSFFEKLEKKEKGKPGTLSKLFGTHPPTPDRITKVHDLLAKFPDRDEYTLSTSEFSAVKNRLLKLTNARTIDASGNRDTGPKRPTLKRRKDAGDDQAQPSSTGTEEPKDKDRPTLKRRDSDGKPPDKKP